MHKLQLPLSSETIATLEAFDRVLLSGTLYVGRDQVHQLLVGQLEREEELPIDLSTATIFYMGPSPAPAGRVIGSCGPTTSARMDPFTPALIEAGLRVMIGKGPRSEAVISSIATHGALYLQAYGGCGALYGNTVTAVREIAFGELGPEALIELTVKDFPAIVAVDMRGNSVFSR